MPVRVVKTATGRYLVPTKVAGREGRTAGYCRVSGADQTADLECQVGRVTLGALERGLRRDGGFRRRVRVERRRVKFSRLLADRQVRTIVVERRDRGARSSWGTCRRRCAPCRSVVVAGDGEVADDLVRDLTETLTSLCSRLYGRRSAKWRADAAVAAMSAPGGSLRA
ncbi:hypothetical protein GCM10023221_00480 [Luteimicrobium xylanilyticum]